MADFIHDIEAMTKSELRRRYKRELYSYDAMKTRCFNPRREDWPRYGGRGITVCDRWLGPEGFRTFLSDMGPRPEATTIDRKDTDGNYEPGNCRWANHIDQASTTSRAVRITVDGLTDTISGWARRIGVPMPALQRRLTKFQADLERGVREVLAKPRLRTSKLSPSGAWSKNVDEAQFIGMAYGRLTIVSLHSIDAKGAKFVCRCQCGGRKLAYLGRLAMGTCTSCGCAVADGNKERAKRRVASNV